MIYLFRILGDNYSSLQCVRGGRVLGGGGEVVQPLALVVLFVDSDDAQ